MRVNRGAKKFLGLGASCMLALAGCTGAEPTGSSAALSQPTSTAPAAAAAAEPGFDVQDVITQARTSFREQDGRLVAGVDTHMVEFQGDAIAVTPTHWPGFAREAMRRSLSRGAIAGDDIAPVSTGAVRAASPFVVSTDSVARGAERVDRAPAAPMVQNGTVEIARGGLVERVRDSVDGVEQSWRFGAAPAGQGDLVVRVGVRGRWNHRGTSERGEHFADPVTGLGVSYGHGTWIDANGTRTAIPVRWDGTALALTVPDAVLSGSTYPAVLDPVIGPEVSMGAPVSGPLAGDQAFPAVSSNGTQWLVVFSDALFGSWDLRAVRVSAAGAVVDASPFDISANPGANEVFPVATWNGTRWIVAWQDGRNTMDWDLYATTIDSAGTVGAPGGGALAAMAGVNETAVRLSSAGSTTLAVWHVGTMAPFALRGVRLDMAGASIDAAPVSIATATFVTPAVGGAATSFLVSWGNGTTGALEGRRINATGTFFADAAPFTLAAFGFEPSIAWGGAANWLVAYSSEDAGGVAFTVNSVLVPTSGAVVVPPTSTLLSPLGTRNYRTPSAAWNGAVYLVAYIDALDDMFTISAVSATRVTAANAVAGTPGLSLSGAVEGFDPEVAAIGSNFLVVWTEAGAVSTDIVGRRVDGSGVVLDATPRVLSSGLSDQFGPVSASDGTNFLVAWTDTVGGEIDVYGVRVSAAGALIGSAAVLAGGAGGQAVTDAAHVGALYVVAFNQGNDAFAVNVASGTGIPGTPYALANGMAEVETNAALACAPTLGCLAAWEQAPMEGAEDDLYARRFDPATGTLSAPVAVSIFAGDQFQPSVAASATQFLIAFTDLRDAATIDVRAARFTTTSMGISIIGGAAGEQFAPDVASDGTDFLVTWTDSRSGGMTPNDVYAARVSGATGASLDGTGFAIAASASANENGPAVAFDGGQYLVTWSRDGDVFGSRVTIAGTVTDSAAPLSIATGPIVQGNSSLTAATGGPFLSTYAMIDAAGSLRARARTIGRDPTGATCASGADCVTGNCVDGVCCGSASCPAGQVCSIAAGGTSDGSCTALPMADAGVDAGTDAGMTMDDAAVVDEDGGVIVDEDGGVGDDGGVVVDEDGGVGDDGGTADTDSGVTPGTDSGTSSGDAGVGPGVDAGPPVDGGGGCSCSVPGGTERRAPYAPLALGGLALAAVMARRRRAR